jgi:hypothetical protein
VRMKRVILVVVGRSRERVVGRVEVLNNQSGR